MLAPAGGSPRPGRASTVLQGGRWSDTSRNRSPATAFEVGPGLEAALRDDVTRGVQEPVRGRGLDSPSRAQRVKMVRDLRPERHLRARAGRQRAQPARRRRRHPARRHGGLHRGLGFGQVVARVRHAVRRGAAPVLRVGRAVRPSAAPAGRCAARAGDHRAPAGRGPPAAAWCAQLAVDGRHDHDAVEPAADALLTSGDLPVGCRAPGRRGLLAEHRRWCLPALPRAGRGARRGRGPPRPGPVVEHPRRRDRGLARCLAGCQPAQHRERSRHRRRQAVEQAEEEGPGLAALHRRAAVGADQAAA